MADALGLKAKMGIKAVTTWGAAYAAVDTAIPFVNESITRNFNRVERSALLGYGGREASSQGVQTCQGTVNFELDYNNFIPILKQAMGAESGGVLTITESVDALYLWLEFEKQVSRYRCGAAKATKFTISGDAGGSEPIKFSVDYICRDVAVSATAFPAITPATPDRVTYRHLGLFRLGDQADALAGGDAMALQSFELSFERSLKGDDYATDATAPEMPLDPVENDFRTSTLKLKFPRYAADTIPAWKDGDTALQCDFLFSGPSSQSFKIECPNMRILDGFDASIDGPGPMILEGTMELTRSLVATMYIGNEFKITIV